MTLKEAITLILTILKQVMEEKLSANNVEVVTVSPDKFFHMLTKEELEQVIRFQYFTRNGVHTSKLYVLYGASLRSIPHY